MYRQLNDFIRDLEHDSATTRKLLDELTDASLKQAAAPGHRTLGELAWHIVTAYQAILHGTGLEFAAPQADRQPSAAADIAAAYGEVTTAVKEALLAQWTDATLVETRNIYGTEWPNGVTLDMVMKHEIHHRGQMTILMRQAGLRMPDIYGPSKDTSDAYKANH